MYPRHFIDTKVIKNPLVYFLFVWFVCFLRYFFTDMNTKCYFKILLKGKKNRLTSIADQLKEGCGIKYKCSV